MTTTRIATPADEAGEAANVSALAGDLHPHFSTTGALAQPLAAQHLRMLAVESAIAPEIIAQRGYYTLFGGNGTRDKLRELGFADKQIRDVAHADVLVLPIWPPDGSDGAVMIRPNNPRIFEGDKLPDGTRKTTVLKYEQPEKAANRLDVNPACMDDIGDPSVDLWITEGIKKGDALASAGLCAASLPGGVWGFMGRNTKNASTVIADLDHVAWKDKDTGKARNVYIAFDSDVMGKEGVRQALHRFTTILRNNGAQAFPVYLPATSDGHKQGVDDFFAAGGTVDQLKAYAGQSRLAVAMVQEAGRPRLKSQDFVDLVRNLGYDPRFNVLTQSLEINGEPLTDVMEARIKSHLRDNGVDAVNVAMEAVLAYAGTFEAYHPIRNALEALEWDGKDHIWRLSNYFEDVHAELFPDDDWRRQANAPALGTFLNYWLVNAVARIFEPRQIRTTMLVIASRRQYIGKSKFVQWLASPFPGAFMEGAINPDDKDDALRSAHKFVWEVGELEATTTRKDVGALKSFITRNEVTVRKAYARHDSVLPTIANYIGTVNIEHGRGFLVDRTGSTRFMVCEVDKIDWRGYTRDVDPAQVWAQAVALYRQGKPYELTGFDQTLRAKINKEHEQAPASADYLPEIVNVTGSDADLLTPAKIIERMRERGFPVTGTTARDIGIYLSQIGIVSTRRRLNGQVSTVYQGVVLL